METDAEPGSAAVAAVQQRVHASPIGTFVRWQDLAGPDGAVEAELIRMAIDGDIVKVRCGVYYRGKITRFGMTRPSLLEVAIYVAGPGSGAAGVSAAHLLGLTTQVPGVVDVATAGAAPAPLDGVRFRVRPLGRNEHSLTRLEVAVIELLIDPEAAEAPWAEVRKRLVELVARGSIRAGLITEVIIEEREEEASERWRSVIRSAR
jgi:hypothetical protein